MKFVFNEVLTESEGAKQPITEWTTERRIKKTKTKGKTRKQFKKHQQQH